MGSQFKKHRRLFPDVLLALSGSGIHVDFGIQPTSMPIADPGNPSNGGWDASIEPLPASGTRLYRRDQPDRLSSHNLIALANLACEVEARRGHIARTIATGRRRMRWARIWLNSARLPFAERLRARHRIAAWKSALLRLQNADEDLVKRLDATVLDLEFLMPDEARAAYLDLVDAFRGVAGARHIWHAAPRRTRPHSRPQPAAAPDVDLKPVRFTLATPTVFRGELPAMRLGHAQGVELFLMPGFLVLRRPGRDLALIEFADLAFAFSPRKAIPQRKPWRHIRTKPAAHWLDEDHAAPEMHGEIEISSRTGLRERFVVSDWRALQALRHAITALQKSLSREQGHASAESAAVPYADIPDLELPGLPDLPWRVRPTTARWIGVAAAAACCQAIAIALFFYAGPDPQAMAMVAAEAAAPSPVVVAALPPAAASKPATVTASVAAPVVALVEAAKRAAPPARAAAAPAIAPAAAQDKSPLSAEEAAAAMPDIVTGAGPEGAPKAEEPQIVPTPARPAPTKPEMNREMDQLVASLVSQAPQAKPDDAAPTKPAAAKPAASKKKAAKTQLAAKQSLSKSEVATLQGRLSALGYFTGSADGNLDGGTIEAFNAWRGETGRSAVRTVGRADYRAFLAAISR